MPTKYVCKICVFSHFWPNENICWTKPFGAPSDITSKSARNAELECDDALFPCSISLNKRNYSFIVEFIQEFHGKWNVHKFSYSNMMKTLAHKKILCTRSISFQQHTVFGLFLWVQLFFVYGMLHKYMNILDMKRKKAEEKKMATAKKPTDIPKYIPACSSFHGRVCCKTR